MSTIFATLFVSLKLSQNKKLKKIILRTIRIS